MRRQDIQLLAQARRGDTQARCELGKRYLLGSEGFTRHVAMGIEHLRHPSLAHEPLAAATLVQHLALHELLALGQLDLLQRAAQDGLAAAQFGLGVWLGLLPATRATGQRWLARASLAGHALATRAAAALADAPAHLAPQRLLQAVAGQGVTSTKPGAPAAPRLDGAALARLAAAQAAQAAQTSQNAGAQDLPALMACLAAAVALLRPAGADQDLALPEDELSTLAPLLAQALALAEASGQQLQGLPGAVWRQTLDHLAAQGDRDAAYTLGRSLSGQPCPHVPPDLHAGHQNVRKGAAYLLRAADAGVDAAWLLLYTLHADHRLSVANPQMARFFLEKGAQAGQAEAQRKLGALMLREASALPGTEQAIAWLYSAAVQRDAHALTLLQSLVLPVAGDEAEAQRVLAQVRATDPWMAARLGLARAFGLTKLEALSLDPAEGLRPWGLVVGRNPFIQQARLAAPRAVPALNANAHEAAQHAAGLYAHGGHERSMSEGDLRNRSLRQRRLFDRLGVADSLFFADASTTTLDSLRLGAKWAYRLRQPLTAALDS